MLPFDKVAIFEPSLVFGTEMPVAFEKEESMQVQAWAEQAAELGANAFYPRIHSLEMRVAIDLVNFYSRNLTGFIPHLLLPSGMKGAIFREFTAIHCREGEEKPAPFRGQPEGLCFGRSCHSGASVVEAARLGFDYVFLSPVFQTQTHPGYKPLGLDNLREVCDAVNIPVLALGGVDRERVEGCITAGAAGIAGIRMFL